MSNFHPISGPDYTRNASDESVINVKSWKGEPSKPSLPGVLKFQYSPKTQRKDFGTQTLITLEDLTNRKNVPTLTPSELRGTAHRPHGIVSESSMMELLNEGYNKWRKETSDNEPETFMKNEKVREIAQILLDLPFDILHSGEDLVFFEATGTQTQTLHVPELVYDEKSEPELRQMALADLVSHGIKLMHEEELAAKDLQLTLSWTKHAVDDITLAMVKGRRGLSFPVEEKIRMSEIRGGTRSISTRNIQIQFNEADTDTYLGHEIAQTLLTIRSLLESDQAPHSPRRQLLIAGVEDCARLILAERERLRPIVNIDSIVSTTEVDLKSKRCNRAAQYQRFYRELNLSSDELLIHHVTRGYSRMLEELEIVEKKRDSNSKILLELSKILMPLQHEAISRTESPAITHPTNPNHQPKRNSSIYQAKLYKK